MFEIIASDSRFVAGIGGVIPPFGKSQLIKQC